MKVRNHESHGYTPPHSCTQTQSCDHIEGVTVDVQLQSGQVSAPFHDHWRRVDTPQHTGDQASIKEAGLSWWLAAEDGKGGLINQGRKFCQPFQGKDRIDLPPRQWYYSEVAPVIICYFRDRTSSNNGIIAQTNDYSADLDKLYYLEIPIWLVSYIVWEIISFESKYLTNLLFRLSFSFGLFIERKLNRLVNDLRK